MSSSAKYSKRLYVIIPSTAMPSRHSFFHFSEQETGSERGSDLAKSYRSGWVEPRIKSLGSEDSDCPTVLGSLISTEA